jgi:hypothetical protein
LFLLAFVITTLSVDLVVSQNCNNITLVSRYKLSQSFSSYFCEDQVVAMETGLSKPPPPHVSPKGMWVSKLCLRILSFIFCIALLGITGTITSAGTFSFIPLVCIAPSVCFPIETELTNQVTDLIPRRASSLAAGTLLKVSVC